MGVTPKGDFFELAMLNQFRMEPGPYFRNRHALLFHAVPVPNGYGIVLEGVEINGHTEWGADFILTTIASADRTGLIIKTGPGFPQVGIEFFGLVRELFPVFKQGEYGDLHGGQAGGEFKYDPFFVAFGGPG